MDASQDRKLCSQSRSAEGARVKSQRILDGAEKLGGQAPERDRLLGVSLATTASRLELRRKGVHALVTTGGSSMAEVQPQPKSPTSPRASRRRASPHRVNSRQTQPSPTGHDRARAPWAGVTTGNRSGFDRPNTGSSSPTDRHHFQLPELARSSPALRGLPMTSVPPAKIGASPEALHDEGVRSQAAALGQCAWRKGEGHRPLRRITEAPRERCGRKMDPGLIADCSQRAPARSEAPGAGNCDRERIEPDAQPTSSCPAAG